MEEKNKYAQTNASLLREVAELKRQVRKLEKENEVLSEKAKWCTEYAAEANQEIIMLKRHIYYLEGGKENS